MRFVYVDDLVFYAPYEIQDRGSRLLDSSRDKGKHLGRTYLFLDTWLDKPWGPRFYLGEISWRGEAFRPASVRIFNYNHQRMSTAAIRRRQEYYNANLLKTGGYARKHQAG